MIGCKKRLSQQFSHAGTRHFFTCKPLYFISRQKSRTKCEEKLNLQSIFFTGSPANTVIISETPGSIQEKKSIISMSTGFIYKNTIIETGVETSVFPDMWYFPPFFFMFIVFSGTLHVKKIARYPQGALPRSGLLPALRQHLLGSVKNYNQFAGIVFVFIMKNCFISCLDKAVKTSSLYRAVSGPIPINSSEALSGPRPHGFLFFLTAKVREETRRKEKTVGSWQAAIGNWLCALLFFSVLSLLGCGRRPPLWLKIG